MDSSSKFPCSNDFETRKIHDVEPRSRQNLSPSLLAPPIFLDRFALKALVLKMNMREQVYAPSQPELLLALQDGAIFLKANRAACPRVNN